MEELKFTGWDIQASLEELKFKTKVYLITKIQLSSLKYHPKFLTRWLGKKKYLKIWRNTVILRKWHLWMEQKSYMHVKQVRSLSFRSVFCICESWLTHLCTLTGMLGLCNNWSPELSLNYLYTQAPPPIGQHMLDIFHIS